MKTEIEIPPQYAKKIKSEAERCGVPANEIVEAAIKKFLERSTSNAE